MARYEHMLSSMDKRQTISGADAATLVYEAVPTFDEKAQLVNVGKGSGHEWQAPRSTDLRGPCPGLNAFANHGFLPRNGYATISQFVDATTKVVGMGPDLAGFLAVFGAAIDGSGTAWSIGGTPAPGVGLGNGLSGSHNKYESDNSPTRPDLYEYGNDYKVVIKQFQQLMDLTKDDSITLDTLTKFRSQRFDDQIANNPYFFNGPFTGVVVQPAAYTFIYRFMANHSAENPVGLLTKDVMKSWFAINGTDNNYQWTEGHERIPDKWYRRAQQYPYSIPYFQLDFVNAAILYPKFLDIGGNLGTKNSFVGVNIANLTGGVLNAGSLLQGNNAACLAYQFAAQVKPDVLLAPLAQLGNLLGSISSKLACPQLKAIDDEQLKQFPGYTRSRVA